MVEHTLHIDFETRSTVDLREAGVGVYARHPSTDVICVAWAWNDEPVEIWSFFDEPRGLARLHECIDHADRIVAHNAAFEFIIWNNNFCKKYSMPPLPMQKLHCTMAMAYSMGLPGNLEQAAAATGLQMQKDMKGSRIMKQLAKPRSFDHNNEPIWWDTPERYEQLFEYCKQDVRVERQLEERLLDLSPPERKLWLVDRDINERGILVDIKAAHAAEKIVEKQARDYDQTMKLITNNFVACCTETGRLREWLGTLNVQTNSVDKEHVEGLLKKPDLPEAAKAALLLRQKAGKTSTAKLTAFQTRAEEDNRLRNILQFYGAHTGRWAGRGVQLHNIPRPTIPQEQINHILEILGADETTEEKIESLEILYGNPIELISNCLRGFLISKRGTEFIGCDFSSIEGRVLAWLSGEEKILELYRAKEDVYKWTANAYYHVGVDQITDTQRDVGKVMELAFGFGGGKGAINKFEKSSSVEIPEKEKEPLKIAWRNNRPATVKYWYDLERAALSAMLNPGKQYEVGPAQSRVKYLKSGSFLFCQLPSKRALCYPYPKVELVDTPWGEPKEGLTYMAIDSYTRKWTRTKTYGGKLAENVTQAVARDVLAESLIRLENKGHPIVLHVHDEAIVESKTGSLSVEEMESIMEEVPHWAKNLPIKAKGWKGKRYQK